MVITFEAALRKTIADLTAKFKDAKEHKNRQEMLRLNVEIKKYMKELRNLRSGKTQELRDGRKVEWD